MPRTTHMYVSIGALSKNGEQRKKNVIDRPRRDADNQTYEYPNPQAGDMELYEIPNPRTPEVIYDEADISRRP